MCDKTSSKETDANDFWTTEAHNSRLALGDGILGIGTECYGPVKGEVFVKGTISDSIDYKSYDHVVEGGIDIKSGVIQILDCPNLSKEMEIIVKPGLYRVRVYSSNLNTVVGDAGSDYYKIELWPDTNIQRTVLKQFTKE